MKPSLAPFVDWMRADRDAWRADLVAGATVAVVAIPQALAYAQLAGMPPHLGLYAAFVPTIVAALFGSSAQLSTGPVALTALLTAASLSAFAEPGSPQWVALAVLLALGAGLMQAAAGFARLGRLVERLPASLMLGFVNAAAIVIVLSQLPAMLGVAASAGGGVLPALRALAT
ncbi:MAG: SulP family inorganic anion transporter, partial [Burkholderiales bacterium]